MEKVILYELNEVPWRVIDTFVERFPDSTLASTLKESLQYTTITKDSGELHPWTTWPTLHRGVYNDTHDIRFINQTIKTPYKPTWEFLAAHKVSTGVFGSLQSWPIPKADYSFYIPDTFSQDAQTHPEALEPFQRFNLQQIKDDGGTQSKKLPLGLQALKDIHSMWQQGLSLKTLLVVIRQVIRELLSAQFKSIRSIYQTPIAFDLFFKLLKDKKPSYATFFTNHAAGMMHRYWKYLYPEDFNYTLKGSPDHFKAHAIIRAMQMTEDQLTTLKEFADQEGYTILIASSMGQEAIDRGEYLGQLHISHMETFYKAIGYEGPIQNNLAMSPDFSFQFETEKDLKHFQDLVLNLTDTNGTPVFGFKQSDLTLNINLQTDASLVKEGGFYRDQKAEKLSFDTLGITIEQRDQGTGYHQPRGIAIFYKKGLEAMTSREEIESIKLTPTILSLFDVAAPSYMKDPLAIKETLAHDG